MMACAVFIAAMFVLAMFIWSIVCCCRCCGHCKKNDVGWSNKTRPSAVDPVKPFSTTQLVKVDTQNASSVPLKVNPIGTAANDDLSRSYLEHNETGNSVGLYYSGKNIKARPEGTVERTSSNNFADKRRVSVNSGVSSGITATNSGVSGGRTKGTTVNAGVSGSTRTPSKKAKGLPSTAYDDII